jgi:hypothetical protein
VTAADAPHPDWDDSYTGPPPPWDIGRPQPAFVRLADAGTLTGALLDAGCGPANSRAPAAAPPMVAIRAVVFMTLLDESLICWTRS